MPELGENADDEWHTWEITVSAQLSASDKFSDS